MKNSGIPFFFNDYKSSTLKKCWSAYVYKSGNYRQYMSKARRIQFEKRRAAAYGNKVAS